MIKYQRNYRLTIAVGDPDFVVKDTVTGQVTASKSTNKEVVIEPPFTIQFNVQRGANANPNGMSVTIFNLSEDTRNKLRFDRYENSNLGNYRQIVLEAGYGDEMNIVFRGNIFQAYSGRQGTNILTYIEAIDGGYDIAYTRIQETIAGGISLKELTSKIISYFPNIGIEPLLGGIEGVIKRGIVLSGNAYDLLRTYAPNVNVDKEKVCIVQPNEAIETQQVKVITSDSGMLETPKRNDGILSVTTLLEPQINLNELVEIKSDILTEYNGLYKVMGLTHSGIISEATGGGCTTALTLYPNNGIFGEFKKI
jgi:hypothetical protein